MNNKGVALLVVAIVVLASLFFFIHITPPGGPIKIPKVAPPKNLSLNYTFFQNETLVPSVLDYDNATLYNFSYTGNVTTVIRGSIRNASTGNLIADQYAYISLYPAGALSAMNSGKFIFTALRGGSGDFFIKAPGYAKRLVNLDLNGKTIWLNLSLQPAIKYTLSGKTEYSNGTIAGNVSLEFSGFFSTFKVISHSDGFYSIQLYNDSYQLTVHEAYLNPLPKPYELNETGKNQYNVIINVYYNGYRFNVSGYVKNVAGNSLSGARVVLQHYNTTTLTNSSGYYELGVPFGFSTIVAYKTGYGYNETTYYFSANVTDFNLTLVNIDPFNQSSGIIPPSLYNSSKYLANSSSSVNYSKKGLYVLEGIITDSFDNLPVAFTDFNFIVNVNGTYFRSNSSTTLNGSYIIYFSYPGTYRILVESGIYLPLVLNVSISLPVTLYNFTVTPVSASIHTIKGTIINSYTKVPISNATVKALLYHNPAYFVYAKTDTNGSYIIKVPESNYSVNATAPGYLPNESRQFNLTANISENLTLVPLNWNKNVWTDELIPGLTVNEVKSALTGAGNYTSSNFYNLSFKAVNRSSNLTINNTQFLVIYRISGVYYYDILYSNGSGLINMGSMEGGSYSFFMVAVDYSQLVVTLDLNSSLTVKEKFDHRQMFTADIVLSDSFNSTSENRSVPASILKITNSSLTIAIQATLEFNGTNFTFDGWNGTFNFSYINDHFIPLNSSMKIPGYPVSAHYNLTPYAIEVTYNAAAAWYYSINNAKPIEENAGSGSFNSFAAAGLNTALFNVSGSNHEYSASADLTNLSPHSRIFFNFTLSSETVNTTGFKKVGTSDNYSFNLDLPTGSLIIGGNVSLDLASSYIYMNGVQQAFTFVNHAIGSKTYSNFTLVPFFFASGNVTMNLVTPEPPNNYIMSQFNLYYYKVALT
ncbi:MAG: carboxypeptidase-like regulatory domain-containing protein [Candidatus Thermoplasmatota archaeon]|nr:carboxypeptidase-like regulatory domain-containing protein [Candidatus Thermoplasmatota archaeon]